MKKIKFDIEFTEEILGSNPADPVAYVDFIGRKAIPDVQGNHIPTLAEIKEGVDEADQETKDLIQTLEDDAATSDDEAPNAQKEIPLTIFLKENGRPYLLSHMFKGLLKSAYRALHRCDGNEPLAKRTHALSAGVQVIDTGIFPQPKKIFLELPEGAQMGYCMRSLRAKTAQGDRIALALSESLPAGTKCHIEFLILSDTWEGILQNWMLYGQLSGIGQWRNSGKGAFIITNYEAIPVQFGDIAVIPRGMTAPTTANTAGIVTKTAAKKAKEDKVEASAATKVKPAKATKAKTTKKKAK